MWVLFLPNRNCIAFPFRFRQRLIGIREKLSLFFRTWSQINLLKQIFRDPASSPFLSERVPTAAFKSCIATTKQKHPNALAFEVFVMWAIQDLNLWPLQCQCNALASWANRPLNYLFFNVRIIHKSFLKIKYLLQMI